MTSKMTIGIPAALLVAAASALSACAPAQDQGVQVSASSQTGQQGASATPSATPTAPTSASSDQATPSESENNTVNPTVNGGPAPSGFGPGILRDPSSQAIDAMFTKKQPCDGEDVIVEAGTVGLDLTGECGSVTVKGKGSIVRVAKAAAVVVEGDNNIVVLGAAEKVTVRGTSNLVQAPPDQHRIDSIDAGNMVSPPGKSLG